MNIVLFRHAKKGFAPFEDPHLSEKIRTHQTFQGFAKSWSLSMTVKPELNLRSEYETGKTFQQRVQKLIDELSVSAGNDSAKKTIYLCSHYDWIEDAMALIPCDRDLTGFEFSHWAPAQFIHFQIESETSLKLITKGQQP